jgi:hypothetical protein
VEATLGAGISRADSGAGRPTLTYQGAERFILDVVLIVAWGALTVALKQVFVHRRRPIV